MPKPTAPQSIIAGNVLASFGNLASQQLDAMKKGAKLDRKGLVALCRESLGIPTTVMSEMNGLDMLAVLLRFRGDFEVVKGVDGGTIKK